MYNRVSIDGRPHHVVVLPDPDATVVNVGGDHTLGGSLAQRLYNPEKPTKDRLLKPQLRVGDTLVPISWGEATDLLARYSSYVLERWGPLSWGMKTYSYQFYENTYAITKLVFDAIESPCWAPHDKAAEGSDTPGLSDAGVNVFSASYQDWKDAEVVFCSGVALYDAHGVLFSQWVKGPNKLIVVNPRRDATADYAIRNGGLFLQIKPGTDTALHNAIARVILEEGWEDSDFLLNWVAQGADLLADQNSWRRNLYSLTFESYRELILADSDADPEVAAGICGITADEIREAARRMAEPRGDGSRPKTSLMLEKGNYWSHNYPNTASFAGLALICGAGNRPGQVISRAGGHQRGMIKAAPYPEHLSPDEYLGHKIGLNLDRWAFDGNLAFLWVIGCTWAGGGAAGSNVLFERVRELTRESTLPLARDVAFPGGSSALDVDAVVQAWVSKAEAGGLVLVQQDLYAQRLTELADLVLPAAGWGEDVFTRMQGERRLRVYAKISDPPGEARPDWRVIAEVAKKMGFEGFDWRSSVEVFEEAGLRSSGPHAYRALLEYAADNRMSARQVLRETGTTGLQCPLSYEDGKIVETVRYHDAEAGRGFSTPSGKAVMVWIPWSEVQGRQETLSPGDDELWVLNRRHSMTWSAMIEDLRVPFRIDQIPVNWIEIHPSDASARGIEDGEEIVIERAGVFPGSDEIGRVEGVAKLSERVRPGVTCLYFNYTGDPRFAANSVVSADVEPITNKNSFKLGRGRVRLK
jgi:arsenite oxidase large subunit